MIDRKIVDGLKKLSNKRLSIMQYLNQVNMKLNANNPAVIEDLRNRDEMITLAIKEKRV